MKKTIGNILKFGFGLAIVVYLLSRIDRQALLETVKQTQVGVFVAGVGVILCPGCSVRVALAYSLTAVFRSGVIFGIGQMDVFIAFF